ncbi:MAG: SDR family NAD(P)-dependent oxidoreductase [Bauldia sp.]|uniref:SDR family NAD(P)-dependent oxidoreductase n=1 Tax=Bauldia sp. TaxID=2575872 RepID=UPI001DE6A677|nr:SDR family NAD(P)-dependent oxidoreductase [Bauldia sp.]MCB1496082.1 SDR family NAD(P)-dependent oxidoreductase [Bauldia sp.]
MPNHPAIEAGRAAVITGGASGIGLAAAKRFAGFGMKIAIADLDPSALEAAAAAIDDSVPGGGTRVITVPCDVSRMEEVQALRERVYDAFGDVAVLMNNAGTAPGGGPFDHYDRWQRVIGVNLWGVINGVHAFSPAMIGQGNAAMIVNTGSKQGITCPPGDTAYNVSKAGVKVITEGLQHSLRNIEDCRVTAHLLVPGWTFTTMTAGGATEKPAGAWWPDQVVDLLFEATGKGDFYIICPDNDVTREMDARRMLWAAGDIAENRPPLSRWHGGYDEAFAAFLKS